jgi:nucleotide-binding universal stress UspA family protein
MSADTNLLGGLLGILIVVGTGGVVWWLTHEPGIVTFAPRRDGLVQPGILVPMWEDLPSEPALELACRIGRERGGRIVLLYMFALASTLPIDAHLPEQEAAGRRALDAASEGVWASFLPVRTYLLPSRSFADTILRVAEHEDVDAVVLGVGQRRRFLEDAVDPTARKVLERAPCEVILVRSLPAAPARSSSRPLTRPTAPASVLDLPVIATWHDRHGAES